jgi:hypothetical protein
MLLLAKGLIAIEEIYFCPALISDPKALPAQPLEASQLGRVFPRVFGILIKLDMVEVVVRSEGFKMSES